MKRFVLTALVAALAGPAGFESAGLICFVYENNDEPQCWSFEKGLSGLIARFRNDAESTQLYEARQTEEPLLCLGPKIGA
jgi:hypothetical protein